MTHHARLLLTAALLLSVVAGCEDDSPGGNPGFWPPPGPPVPPLAEGSQGAYANVHDEFVHVGDPVSWSFLHRWVSGSLPEPAADFDGKVVAGIILDEQATDLGIVFTDPGDGYYSYHYDGGLATVITRPWAFLNLVSSDGFVTVWQGDAGLFSTELTYGGLVTEDYGARSVHPAAAADDLDDLADGLCPIDGTTLAEALIDVVTVPEVTLTAHYCPAHGLYWVRSDDLNEPEPAWTGPYAPGVYP